MLSKIDDNYRQAIERHQRALNISLGFVLGEFAVIIALLGSVTEFCIK